MDIATNMGTLLIGGAAGGGVIGLLALLLRLLFSREASEYARLDARIATLEEDLRKERTEHLENVEKERAAHMECIHKMGLLEGRVEQLTIDINQVIARHSKAQGEQIALNRENIVKVANDKGIDPTMLKE